jgi:hypothetical protein
MKAIDLKRKMYNMAAQILCDQSCGDLYDAYLRLAMFLEMAMEQLAFNHVVVGCLW